MSLPTKKASQSRDPGAAKTRSMKGSEPRTLSGSESDAGEVFTMPPDRQPDPLSSQYLSGKFIECLRFDSVREALGETMATFIDLAVEEAVNKKLSGLKENFDKMCQENLKLQQTVNILQTENKDLKERLSGQERNVNEIHKAHRELNLVVRGLPERTYAERSSPNGEENATEQQPSHLSVQETVTEFIRKEMNINLTKDDIQSAFRFKAGEHEKSRPIIVRFINPKIRHQILISRKILKEKEIPVYIHEHLTKPASDLFAKARGLVKRRRLFAAYTRNGHVFIKQQNNSTPKLIKVPEDLPAELWVFFIWCTISIYWSVFYNYGNISRL